MTIRTKINLAIATTIAIFLVAAMYAVFTVRMNARYTQGYLHMRGQSQLISDMRADIYRHASALHGSPSQAASERRSGWPTDLIEDIEVQIRLAEAPQEQQAWSALRETISVLGVIDRSQAAALSVEEYTRKADRQLRQLRDDYDNAEHQLVATVARAGLRAEIAIMGACLLAVLGFLVYVLMVRDWLVKPIEVLKQSADTIGQGELEHRVPLEGRDELAQLGRCIDAMAEGLQRHQTALLEARELSAVGELCRNVAHGLRNPLAAIRVLAQMGARRNGAGPERATFQDLIEQVDRMDSRITRLMEFGRPPKTQRDKVTFAELAAQAVCEAQPLIEANELLLRVEDNCEQHHWLVDREQLSSAIAELLTNAAHHSPAARAIILRGLTSRTPDGSMQLRVDVQDSGCGMKRSTRDKAFGLFFTSRPQGTGVGLAMVKRVVERHGGSVHVLSTPGQGTTMSLFLPCGAGESPVRVHAASVLQRPRHNGRNAAALLTVVVAAMLSIQMPLHAGTLALRAIRINDQPMVDGPVSQVNAQPNDRITVALFVEDCGAHALRGIQAQLDPTTLTPGLQLIPASCVIDTLQPNFLAAGLSLDPIDGQAFAAVDTVSAGCRWTAGFIDPELSRSVVSAVYAASMDLLVAPDAVGVFTVRVLESASFLRDAGAPAQPITPLVFNPLVVQVGSGCISTADCADANADGLRDDVCVWWSCVAGSCQSSPVSFADVGGVNGSCEPDGATDGNDRFHVLNCFSNQTTLGHPGYPCEVNPPIAFNVDAGGPSGACAPDGVCDGNDAFHVLNTFEGISTCSCAPQPGSPQAITRRRR